MILLYNTNATRNPNAYLTLAVEDALRRVVGADRVERVDERSLARSAASGRHELLICLDGQRLDAGLIARVRPALRRVVLWAFEDPFMLDYNLSSLDLFDLVFTNDPSCVPAYRGRGRFLPLAGSRMLQFRDVREDASLRHDIFFAGTMWPNRIPALRRIIAAFPDASMKLICTTNEYLPPLPRVIAERALTRPISHPAFIDFANSSRVTLTLFRDYASHGNVGRATAPGPRLYELAMAGTAQVIQCDPKMQAERFDGMEGVAFAGGDTLVGRIEAILSDPERRHAMASDAQRAALASHGYEHRIAELLSQCGEAPRHAAAPVVAEPLRGQRRLRVLMCTHSIVHNQVWGGVEVYQAMLGTLLQSEVETFTWIRRDGACRLLDQQGRTLEQFDAEDIGWLDVLCDPFEEAHFSNILASYAIDVVHFQHLGHHAASLPLIARACGVGSVLSVHDFFLVCTRYNLLDHEQKFCDIGNRAIGACTVCLSAAEGLPPGVQQQRRGFIEQVLGSIDLLLFGSRQSEELVLRIYPQARNLRRMVLGIPQPPAALPRSSVREATGQSGGPAASGRLEIAVVGNFLRTKGAETVLRVIEAARPDLFRFHILGMAEPQYLAPLAAFGERVVYHGRYAPGELSLSRFEVALHLSIWPETWCISLSEAWEAGLIPIVSDIGALGERVTHGRDGFKVAVGDAAGVLDLIETLRANPPLRARMRGAIGPHLWSGAVDYARTLLEEYRTLAPRAPLGRGRLGLAVPALHLLPQRSWKELAAPRHILDADPPARLQIELPAAIREWASIQGCTARVDRICDVETDPAPAPQPGGQAPDAAFAGSPSFSIHGWAFPPGASQSGQAFVCLIHRGGRHVVFIEAGRVSRPDVLATHPEAPLRCGYEAEARLMGKWADGEYAVGVILVTDGRAAFHLTPHLATVADGRVSGLASRRFESRDVLHDFACVFHASPDADAFLARHGSGPSHLPLPPTLAPTLALAGRREATKEPDVPTAEMQPAAAGVTADRKSARAIRASARARGRGEAQQKPFADAGQIV